MFIKYHQMLMKSSWFLGLQGLRKFDGMERFSLLQQFRQGLGDKTVHALLQCLRVLGNACPTWKLRIGMRTEEPMVLWHALGLKCFFQCLANFVSSCPID